MVHPSYRCELHACQASSNKVTGPSLTSATCMSARNRPVATGTPSSASACVNVSISGSATLGRGGGRPTRAAAAAGVAVERELAHDERGPAGLEERVVHGAVGSSSTLRFATFAASRLADTSVSSCVTPTSDAKALTDHADDLAVDEAVRLGDPLHECPHVECSVAHEPARSASALHAPVAREPVHPRAVQERLLARARVRVAALPRGQRRRPAARGRTRTRSPTGADRSLLIASRFAVASSSPWPPDRNTMPGTAAGTTLPEAPDRRVGDRLGRAPSRRRTSCRESPCSA